MLLGFQTQLQDAPATTVDDGENIIFDTIINDQTPSITYDGTTGEFTISASGNYFISWWVAVDGTEGPVNVAFATEIDGTDAIIGTAPTVTGQVNGSAFITVTTVPAVITLVNATGATVSLAGTAVQANLVILQIFP